MKTLAAVLAALSLAAVACGDSAESPSASRTLADATATAEPLPYSITAPRAQGDLAPSDWSFLAAHVLSVATGEVQAVAQTFPKSGGRNAPIVQWIDDVTVAIAKEDGRYRIDLDGNVTAEAESLATPTPSAMPDVPQSADGLWSAERNLAISGITLTERATGRRFDLPDTDEYQWAPAGHLMATGGGWCGGGRVSIVDPDTSSITQITPGGPEGHGVVYVWRPDGKALALDLLSPQLSLALVDARPER